MNVWVLCERELLHNAQSKQSQNAQVCRRRQVSQLTRLCIESDWHRGRHPRRRCRRRCHRRPANHPTDHCPTFQTWIHHRALSQPEHRRQSRPITCKQVHSQSSSISATDERDLPTFHTAYCLSTVRLVVNCFGGQQSSSVSQCFIVYMAWLIDWLSMVLRLHQHNIGYTADGFYRFIWQATQ